ncbi:MAG: hypothetical protein ABIH34_07485 [Nanoarchaeota archaeon]
MFKAACYMPNMQLCPKCGKVTLSYDISLDGFRCSSCGFTQGLQSMKE